MANTSAIWQQAAHTLYHHLQAAQQEPFKYKKIEHFLEKIQENGLLAGKMTRLKEPNSKHWFMTSFLQPLPYLIVP